MASPRVEWLRSVSKFLAWVGVYLVVGVIANLLMGDRLSGAGDLPRFVLHAVAWPMLVFVYAMFSLGASGPNGD